MAAAARHARHFGRSGFCRTEFGARAAAGSERAAAAKSRPGCGRTGARCGRRSFRSISGAERKTAPVHEKPERAIDAPAARTAIARKALASEANGSTKPSRKKRSIRSTPPTSGASSSTKPARTKAARHDVCPRLPLRDVSGQPWTVVVSELRKAAATTRQRPRQREKPPGRSGPAAEPPARNACRPDNGTGIDSGNRRPRTQIPTKIRPETPAEAHPRPARPKTAPPSQSGKSRFPHLRTEKHAIVRSPAHTRRACFRLPEPVNRACQPNLSTKPVNRTRQPSWHTPSQRTAESRRIGGSRPANGRFRIGEGRKRPPAGKNKASLRTEMRRDANYSQ